MNTTRLLKKVRGRKKLNKKQKYNVSTATIFALCEIHNPREVAEMTGCSIYLINSIKSGKRLIEGDLDNEVIREFGLKVCEACEMRLVPSRTLVINNVRVELRKLCLACFKGETETISYPVHYAERLGW